MKHTELLKKLRDGHYEINDEAADAIESLQAEVERLTLACNKAAQAELDLLAERAALKLDAERYRWFSAIAVSGDFEKAEKAFSCFENAESCTNQELDDAIDAAIAAMKGAA